MGGSPGKHHLAGAVQLGTEPVYRQRLHHIGNAVTGAEEFQDAFVYASAGREAETRIQTVTHVGKVLVGKQFQQQAGHTGGAALTVTAVPNLAPGPVGFIGGADVFHNLGLDQVGQ